MAYGRKYYKEFDGYNAATRQSYSVLVDIYEDGFAGTAIEIEEVSASPLQLSLDSSGDPLYTSIKKTSATFNIINTNQFDYSEFYTSNAKKYKMMITSTVFNWTGYLVPQAVSFDLATNGEFSLTASDGLHLLQSIDYKANENDMTTLAAFLTDIETKIGLSTFNRTSTINTEYGDIWNSLIYKGMLVGKTYEEAFEMVLKAIGMQVRYWKVTPIISIESALQTASVKCTNEYPELNFLAPIRTAKLTKNITTLPSAFKNALVDDISDLKPRAANSYNTLTNWTVVSDNGLVVFDIGANETDRKANKYKYINMFVKPTNATYDTQRLTGNEGSYFQLRPVQKTPFTLSFNANFGRISEHGRSSADGYRAYIHPVKWSSIKWGLYDSVSNKSYSKTTNSWSITGTPTAANANELKVTDPADSFVDVYIPIPAPTGLTANLRFYLFTGAVEYVNAAPVGKSRTNRLSIQSIDIDGEYIVSENELYTSVNGVVAVGDNIDVLDYEVDFGYCPQPPLNTSLYYGSALFDNNLNQLEDIIIGANTVSHEQYLFNTILYTQNEIRKKVYTANVNMLTNVSPFWLKTTLKTDTVMVNACNFDFKTSQLNGEFYEIMPYVYREWAITSESEIGSSDWGGSGGQTGGSSGGGTVDTSNFVVKTGATDQAIEGILRPGNLLSNGAVVAKSLAPTDVAEWPQAGQNVDGVVRYDNVTIKRNANGQLYAIASGGTAVSWGTEVANQSVQLIVASINKTLALASHTHNYQPLDADLTAIAALSGTSGLLKKTAADTWVLDTASYLTAITKTMVEAVLTGNITSHTHNQYLLSSSYTAADILTKLGTVDGAGSGLDADLLDGQHGENYYRVNMGNTADMESLVPNGLQFISSGNANFGGDLPATIEGTVANFNGFSKTSQALGFKLLVPTSTDKSLYYNSFYNAWRGWVKLYDTQNSNKKTVDWNAKNMNCVNGYADGAVVAKYLSSSYATDWPEAGTGVKGIVKYDGTTIALNANGQLTVVGGGWSNVAWGTPTSQSVPLTVDSITRNLSLDGHTHSYLPLTGGRVEGDLVLGTISSPRTLVVNYVEGENSTNLNLNRYGGQVLINNQTAWHAGNDGTGSGLDADMLDGLQPNQLNVLSATKLANTRTIWGQPFNGEGDVSGAINNATTGTFSSTISATTGIFSNLTANYIPKHTAGGLINGLIYDNGTNVGIGRTDAAYKLDVNGTFRSVGAGYFNNTLTVTNLLSGSNSSMSGYSTANRFYAGYDSGIDNSISCSNWFRSNGATGWLNATYTAGILSDTANIVRTYSTNKFKVFNTEADSIYTLGGLKADGAVVAKYLSSSYATDWPEAGTGVKGIVKYDGTTIALNANGQLTVVGGGWSNVAWGTPTTNYVPLTVNSVTRNLALDGHTHSYYLTAITKTMVEAVLTGNITTHTHSQYLTAITKDMVEAVLTGDVTTHSHSQYLLASAYTASDVLTKIKTVDGAGSGLDADMLDGLQPNQLNVLSATKLANTRTIWGQTFNGEGDVDGTLTVTNIGNPIIKLNSTFNTENNRNWDISTSGNAWGDFDIKVSPSYNTAPSISTVTIKNNGNVGIGITAPQTKLDVNGTFRTTGAAYLNSTLDVATSVTSPSFIGNASTATRLNSARTFALTGDVTGSITSDLLSGVSIATTIQPNSVELGTDTTGNYAGSVLVSGNGLSITGVAGEGTAFTVISNATSLNTANTIMFRDASGDYHARNGLHDGTLVAKYLSSTFATDWPVMTASVQGVAKAGSSMVVNAGTLDIRNRHYTTTTSYTDAAARDITAKIALGTGNMTSGTLDQIKLDFAPTSTTTGINGNLIITATGAGAGLIVSFREDSGTGRYYACIYNPTGATVVRDGIYISISCKQTV